MTTAEHKLALDMMIGRACNGRLVTSVDVAIMEAHARVYAADTISASLVTIAWAIRSTVEPESESA